MSDDKNDDAETVLDRGIDDRPLVHQLLANLKAAMPALEELWERASGEWGYEDRIYRLYHHSWKVFALQDRTTAIVEALAALAPDGKPLHEWFLQIVADGTGKTFKPSHNARWPKVTRPIVEAFFHARYFLEMVMKYGRELAVPPNMLPSGWAAVLELYGLR